MSRTRKSETLAAKIAEMKRELIALRRQEKKQARTEARRRLEQTIAASGLLALVQSGAIDASALEQEFKAIAARRKLGDAAAAMPEPNAPEPASKPSLWGRG